MLNELNIGNNLFDYPETGMNKKSNWKKFLKINRRNLMNEKYFKQQYWVEDPIGGAIVLDDFIKPDARKK